MYCLYLIRNSKWNIQTDNLPTEYQGADTTEVNHYKRLKEELTVNDDASVILRGSQIVVPERLRERAVSLAHEGHPRQSNF